MTTAILKLRSLYQCSNVVPLTRRTLTNFTKSSYMNKKPD